VPAHRHHSTMGSRLRNWLGKLHSGNLAATSTRDRVEEDAEVERETYALKRHIESR
jgi:hypothetical protein